MAAGIDVPPGVHRLGITNNPVELFCVASASYIYHACRNTESAHISPQKIVRLLKAFCFLCRNPTGIKLTGLEE